MKPELTRAILESPFAGAMRENRIFAENVVRRLLYKGWNCFASHLYYPHFLDENIPEEREFGIAAGLQWSDSVKHVFFALPEHVVKPSRGMIFALQAHHEASRILSFGIYNPNGELRHDLPEEWFIHPEGWKVAIQEAAARRVRESE